MLRLGTTFPSRYNDLPCEHERFLTDNRLRYDGDLCYDEILRISHIVPIYGALLIATLVESGLPNVE